jgi:hypothetical protein
MSEHMPDTGNSDISELAPLIEEVVAGETKDPQRIISSVRECRQLGIDVLPLDINRSDRACQIEDGRYIRLGFSLLVSGKALFLDEILSERQNAGPFRSFQDFCERVDLDRLPEEFITRIIQIGGFDAIEPSRSQLFQGRYAIIQAVRATREEQATGQFSLFSVASAGQADPLVLPEVEHWTEEQRIAQEIDAIGISITECLLDEDEREPEVLEDFQEPAITIEQSEMPSLRADNASQETPLPTDLSAAAQVGQGGEPALQNSATETPSHRECPSHSSPFLSALSGSVANDNFIRNIAEPEPAVTTSDAIASEQTPIIPDTSSSSEEPPLPPMEFTAEEYDVSFPAGLTAQESDALYGNTATVKEQFLDDAEVSACIIQLSTIATTPQRLLQLQEVLQNYPGTSPVFFEFIDLENRTTLVRSHKTYQIENSNDCITAIEGVTGYHTTRKISAEHSATG